MRIRVLPLPEMRDGERVESRFALVIDRVSSAEARALAPAPVAAIYDEACARGVRTSHEALLSAARAVAPTSPPKMGSADFVVMAQDDVELD